MSCTNVRISKVDSFPCPEKSIRIITNSGLGDDCKPPNKLIYQEKALTDVNLYIYHSLKYSLENLASYTLKIHVYTYNIRSCRSLTLG